MIIRTKDVPLGLFSIFLPLLGCFSGGLQLPNGGGVAQINDGSELTFGPPTVGRVNYTGAGAPATGLGATFADSFEIGSTMNLGAPIAITYGTTVASPIAVRNDNGALTNLSPQIRSGHPRLYLSTNRLNVLRQKAQRDANGNSIGIPTDENWNSFIEYISGQVTKSDGQYDYGLEGWQFALAYVVTREARYRNKAIEWADKFYATFNPAAACPAFYPAGLPTSFHSSGACFSNGQFLYAHYYIRNMALIYDWLYDDLDVTRRANYRTYLSNLSFRFWENRTDGGWGINDPLNNYHHGYLIGSLFYILAVWEDDPGDKRSLDLWNYLTNNKLPGVFKYVTGIGRGGYWHEGTHYGRKSKEDLLEFFILLRDATTDSASGDIFAVTGLSYFKDLLKYQLYTMQPDLFRKQGQDGYNYTDNSPTLLQVGDLPSNSQGPVTPGDVHIMSTLADGLRNFPEGRYASYWLKNLSHGIYMQRRYRIAEFLAEDPAVAESDYRTALSGSFITRNLAHNRSNWTSDATAVTFISAEAPQVTSHQHRDQNSFVIWHKGWQAADLNSYSPSGISDNTYLHNTILVRGMGQRNIIQENTRRQNEVRTGYIKNSYFDATKNLMVVTGDATGAYGELINFGQNVSLYLNRFYRTLVHLEDLVIVYDSIQPVQTDDEVRYMVHNRGNFQISGNTAIASAPCGENMGSNACISNGLAKGKIFHTTLLPANVLLGVRSNNPDTRGSGSNINGFGLEFAVANQATHEFLNVMYMADVSTVQNAEIALATSTGNQFQGCKVKSPRGNLIAYFRPETVNTISYSGTDPDSFEHVISGLQNGNYQVSRNGIVIVTSIAVNDAILHFFSNLNGVFSIERL
jgi:hypothetical protein